MAAGWLIGLAISVALVSACVGNPNGNPVVDVAPVCAADSQDEQFFGSAFTRDNESGRAQRVGRIATLTAIAPRHDPVSGTDVAERIERQVTADEWARIVDGVAAIDVVNSRAIPLPEGPGDYSTSFLFEFRARGTYSIILRAWPDREEALSHLKLRLIDLAGCDYRWGCRA